MTPPGSALFHAEWIVPEPGQVIRDAGLLCRAGRVAWRGRWQDRPPPEDGEEVEEIDLGRVAVLPGFVNAHTHLELTDMEGRLSGEKGFLAWARSMRRLWRGWCLEERWASVRHGARRSLDAGVTCIGQIAASPDGDAALPRTAPLRMRVFHEVIAPGWVPGWPMVAAALWRRRRVDMAEAETNPDTHRLRYGLAPHAPYSVSRRTLRRCFVHAAKRHEPVTIHASETEDEIKFCRHGTGELADFLRRKRMLGRHWKPAGESPIACLARAGLGRGARALVAHANYATDDEIRWLGRQGIAVAWCPPSHRFFGHRPWPLRKMLDAGVPVCVATDSLASADTLNPLEALREARAGNRLLDTKRALAAITTNPALALGWPELGRLAEPCFADFSVWDIDGNERNPAEAMLRGNAALQGVRVGGVSVRSSRARS